MMTKRELVTQEDLKTVHSSASGRQQLNATGFKDIEMFAGAEQNWQNWSSKVRTAVSGSGKYSDVAG